MIGKDEKIASQANSLSGDEESVAKLLYSLPRVEASKDFEFRVKARIAQRRTAPSRPGYVKALAYAAPLFLILVVASVFFLRQPSRGEEISQVQPAVEVMTEKQDPAPTVEQPSSLTVSRADIPAVPAVNRSSSVAVERQPAEPARREGRPGRIRGGSFDTAVSPSDTILPRGLNANSAVHGMPKPGAPGAKQGVSDILSTYGVTATRVAGRWTVSGVSGIAANSGVQKGDIIESQQTDSTGTRLNIRRGSSKIQIALKP